MYGNTIGIGAGLRWSQHVQNYARWEYGRDAEAWLLATAAEVRRRRGPHVWQRIRAALRRVTTPRLPSVDGRFAEE